MGGAPYLVVVNEDEVLDVPGINLRRASLETLLEL